MIINQKSPQLKNNKTKQMYFPNTEHARELLCAVLSELEEDIIVGVTSGCFDVLHPLHVQYLEKCKANCDMLIVGVDTDALVYANKEKKPIFSEHDRGYMVASLSVVDVAFGMDCLCQLEALLHALVGGTDDSVTVRLYKAQKEYYGEPVLKVDGVETIEVPDVYPANSTTDLVRFIQNSYTKL